jgi:esterase
MSSGIHASVTGEGPPVLLIHGLFGMGSNLGALARTLQDRYSVHSIDLPNHGRSVWLADASLAGMAQHLRAYLDGRGISRTAVVGHSLGGKVGMELALGEPDRVAALVVADIAPVSYPPHHDSVFSGLQAVAMARPSSRSEARDILAQSVEEPGVIDFLLLSLARDAQGHWNWRFNLEVLLSDYASVRAAPAGARQFGGPVLFIKGGASEYIRSDHRDVVNQFFPAAQLKIMDGCGHWLHAEQPRLFNGIVGRFLDQAGVT